MSAMRKMSVMHMLLAVLCAMLYGDHASASSLENALRDAPMGKPVMIGPLLGPEVEAVCALQPYQDQLTARDDVAKRLNAQLRAQALAVDESHFTFVIVRNHVLQLNRQAVKSP